MKENDKNKVDMVHYMGFQSYGVHQVPTKKPGVDDYYVKDAYKDIANYNKRKVNYFDDKVRYSSIYHSDYVKPLKEEDYTKAKDQTLKIDLGKYEYSYDPNLVKMITDKNCKEENYVREKFAETQKNPDRQRSFSHWTTTYDFFNKESEERKNNTEYKPASIDPHFKNRYHRYHVGCYKNEHHTAMGVYGDIPFEKFFLKNQPKLHSSNYELSLGTTKPTNFIPGYAGFIPVNKYKPFNDRINDPYFNVNKTNHMLNYKVRLPNYQGYIPQNPQNIKGNSRPFCLSTEGETFN